MTVDGSQAGASYGSVLALSVNATKEPSDRIRDVFVSFAAT
jgi:hypothetical protein